MSVLDMCHQFPALRCFRFYPVGVSRDVKESGMIGGMADSLWLLAPVLATIIMSMVITRAMRRLFSRFRSRELKAGKELIYRHFPKKKKPLGGGVAILLSFITGLLLAAMLRAFHLLPILQHERILVWLACGLAFAAIGFIDDWRKVNAALGLQDWVKLALQIFAAAFFSVLIIATRQTGTAGQGLEVFLPFIGWVEFGYLFIPFSMLVLVGASNAVNLTDGLDGLAGMSLSIAYAGYLLLALLLNIPGIPLLIPLLVLAALTGFLFYNRPPARIIMGDTGALGLGAGLGALALISRTEWLLLLFAAPFIIDTVSVIIQVSVIKFFRKPVKLLRHQTTEVFRPFLCTPLHHHFQWLTWGPWPILALFGSVGFFSMVLGLLAIHASAGASGFAWFWTAGLLLQAAFLIFAALQKIIRANYFLGLERVEGEEERRLALYKGLPVEFFNNRWYYVEETTTITESMIQTIAAESILWRNISEIEARATLGKIYAEYKLFDRAAEEWEEIPLRNLLIRHNLVVQLGKIYFGRDELLRAIKLWEQLPPSQLQRVPGLSETIRSAKVRVGHLSGRLYHQVLDHVARVARQATTPAAGMEIQGLVSELERALRSTQELRDLLAYEQQKAEGAGELTSPTAGTDIYRRMDATLASRREELHSALRWAQGQIHPDDTVDNRDDLLHEVATAFQMTPAEISHALGVKALLAVHEFNRIDKPSRNSLYRIILAESETQLPPSIVAKCFEDDKVTFFSACYRRERGVMEILQQTGAPVPRILGGHLGTHLAVLFQEDLGTQDLISALQATAFDDYGARRMLLRLGIEALVALRIHALSAMSRIEREIAKIVKEALTPEYYLNTTIIALNRILALEGRQLALVERAQLDMALRPLVARLLDEPKTFIHFEFTPGNLLLVNDRAIAMDFEQATIGPAAFDLATLLYSPDANLREEEIVELLAFYHELLPPDAGQALLVRPRSLRTAAIIKLFFYAGSAANFYRKFEEGGRLSAMEWYLRTADTLLAREPDFNDLADFLRRYWHGQTHLPV